MTTSDGDNRSAIVSFIILLEIISMMLLTVNDLFLGNHELIYAASLFLALTIYAVSFGYIFLTDASNGAKRTVSFIMSMIAIIIFVITVTSSEVYISTARMILEAVSGFLFLFYTPLTFFIAKARNPVRIQH